jgi:hypothetical protein
MVTDGETIKDGGDCAVDLCATPLGVSNSIAGMAKATEAICPEVLIV